VHDGFAIAFAERGIKSVAVVEGEIVARKGLAAVFVYSLQYLLCMSVFSFGSLFIARRGGRTLYPAA